MDTALRQEKQEKEAEKRGTGSFASNRCGNNIREEAARKKGAEEREKGGNGAEQPRRINDETKKKADPQNARSAAWADGLPNAADFRKKKTGTPASNR